MGKVLSGIPKAAIKTREIPFFTSRFPCIILGHSEYCSKFMERPYPLNTSCKIDSKRTGSLNSSIIHFRSSSHYKALENAIIPWNPFTVILWRQKSSGQKGTHLNCLSTKKKSRKPLISLINHWICGFLSVKLLTGIGNVIKSVKSTVNKALSNFSDKFHDKITN